MKELKVGQKVKCPKGEYKISYFLEVSSNKDFAGDFIKHRKESYKEGFEIMIKGIGLYTENEIELIPEKSSREQAIEWWNNISEFGQYTLCPKERYVRTLTGREIEEIWRKETQKSVANEMQEDANEMWRERLVKEFNDCLKPQVNFERLNLTINHLLCDEEILKYYAQSELFNLALFFEMLIRSSSFAHKAHKELNKLNQ